MTMKALPSRRAMLFAILLVAACAGVAQAQVNINLGNLPNGQSVTLSYEVNVNSPLAPGQGQISAQGTVSGDNFAAVNTDDPETVAVNDPTITSLNEPPVAGPDTIERFETQGTNVLVTTLLANDTDADGDTLSITSVSSPSPGGATVTTDGERVYYTPLPGFTSSDSFTYTVSDGRGGTATGTVTVNTIMETDTARIAGIQHLGNGTFRITFKAVPGRTYRIQFTETLNPPNTAWTTLGTATADAAGAFIFEDTAMAVSRFYRSAYP